jgi:DNA-binding MarR family transcriptional regulator
MEPIGSDIDAATAAMNDASSVAAAAATARAMLDAFEVFDTLWRIEWGLSPSEKLVITHLWSQGTATMSDLAVRTGMTSGGATSLIDRLERDGYVQRRADPTDRRRQLVSLTDKGSDSRAELARTLEVAVRHVGADHVTPIFEALRSHFDAGAEIIRGRLSGRATASFPASDPASE